MKPIRVIQYMLLLLTLLKAFGLFVEVRAADPQEIARLAMPLAVASEVRRVAAVAPPPTTGVLPTEMVATWSSGIAPLQDFYNPITGEWRKASGLGQMYHFGSNGHYVYAAYLRLQTGLCISEVSTYREGKAKATSDKITLTPTLAKTRTVIQCGSNSETVTDGPFDPVTMSYDVMANAQGQHQLTLTAPGTNMILLRQ